MRASQIAQAQTLLSKLHGARRQLEVISNVPRIPEGLIIMVQGTNNVVTLDGPVTDISGFVRGRTREEAKAEVRKLHPAARFFR